jgi:nucleotide-binding universal stress UspA family protein
VKLLVALDCSPHSRRAAGYAAAVVPHVPGTETVLFSVLRGVPYSEAELAAGAPSALPEVHGDEDSAREVMQVRSFLEEVASLLRAKGVPAERLQVVVKPVRRGIPQDIVDEALALGCDTIVVGRRRLSLVGELLQGSVSREVVQKGDGRAIWIVE